jgi:hypothetical protein
MELSKKNSLCYIYNTLVVSNNSFVVKHAMNFSASSPNKDGTNDLVISCNFTSTQDLNKRIKYKKNLDKLI